MVQRCAWLVTLLLLACPAGAALGVGASARVRSAFSTLRRTAVAGRRRADPAYREITKIQHDAAIVYAGRPFALVVLVRGLQDARQGSALAADITRVLYRASQNAAGK